MYGEVMMYVHDGLEDMYSHGRIHGHAGGDRGDILYGGNIDASLTPYIYKTRAYIYRIGALCTHLGWQMRCIIIAIVNLHSAVGKYGYRLYTAMVYTILHPPLPPLLPPSLDLAYVNRG